jgi:hypothetical protein
VDPYPYGFGSPGSGFVIICTDPNPDPSITSKNSKKPLLMSVFVIFYDLLSLKNDVNVPSASNKKKT